MTSNRSGRGTRTAPKPGMFGLSPEDLRALGYGVAKAGPDSEPAPDPASPPGSGDPERRRWVASLSILLIVAWGSGIGRSLPAPVPATAADTVFSAGRAAVELAEVTRGPHVTGSPEHDRVRNHLLRRLDALGFETDVQTATVGVPDSALARAATVRNIVARLPGSASTGAVLLTAPYDTAPLSSGGEGDRLGLAAILEAMRSVVSSGPLRNDLIVLFTDGHALGDLGARAFAERHPYMSDVALFVSIAVRGAEGPVVVFDQGAMTGGIVQEHGRLEPRSIMSSLAAATWEGGPGVDLPFPARGARGFVMTTSSHASRPWTTAGGLPAVERTLQQLGGDLLTLTRHFGQAALDPGEELTGPTRAYFTLPVLGPVQYPADWGLPFTLGLLASWLLLIRFIELRSPAARAIGVGLAAASLSVGASALGGVYLLEVLRALHPEYGTLTTASYRDGPLTLALAAWAVATVSLTHALVRRWFRVEHLVLGALAVPLTLCVWLTLAAPRAAPAVQWPLAGALLGAALVGAAAGRPSSRWAWAASILMPCAVLMLAVPTLEIVAGAWTLHAAAPLGALFAVGALMTLPALDRLLRPRAWWLSATGVAMAGALVALTLPAVQGGREHPMPTSLAYLTEGSRQDRTWPTTTVLPAGVGSSGTSRVPGQWLTVPGPGEPWARSWVGQPTPGSRDPGVLLLDREPWSLIGTGPDAEIGSPDVRVREVATEGAFEEIEIAVRSRLGGEMVGLHLPDDVEGELLGVGGATWEKRAVPVRSLVHWGRPEREELRVRLLLGPSAGEAYALVIEHHLRPQEVLGDYFFQRADSLVPNATIGTDRFIQRTRIRLVEGLGAVALETHPPRPGGP